MVALASFMQDRAAFVENVFTTKPAIENTSKGNRFLLGEERLEDDDGGGGGGGCADPLGISVADGPRLLFVAAGWDWSPHILKEKNVEYFICAVL